jgi:sodium transport system permease protein
MSTRTVWTIFKKELLDMLRDKRTLIAMVAIPIVLYPALILIGSQAAIVQQNKMEQTVSRVVLVGESAEELRGWFEAAVRIELASVDHPERALAERAVDALIRVEGSLGQVIAAEDSLAVSIEYDVAEPRSRTASERIRKVLGDKEEELLAARLEAHRLTDAFVDPLEIRRKNVAPPTKAAGQFIGLILPFIMIVMLAVGALYPAIDLTAGEKERGTFETLLSTPASTFEIVCGKFLTVFSIALLTGILNLGSMTFSIAMQLHQLRDQIGEMSLELPPNAVAAILLVLVPLAFFIAAAMMTIGAFARSFREAQNFMMPFMVVLMLPAAFSTFPGVELTGTMRLIPIANVALLFRDLIMGTATVDAVFIVFTSTAAFAMLTLLFATWVFQREDIILSEERGIPLTFRRAQFLPKASPTPGFALFLYAVALLLLFYVAGPIQVWHPYWGLAITQWVLLLLPVLGFLVYTKIDLKEALSLRAPQVSAFFPVLLVTCAWVPMIIQAGVWHNRVFPMPEEMEAALNALFVTESGTPNLIMLLAVIAVSPAICEEVLFRGAVFSGLRRNIPPWALVLTVGILFGVFHLIVYRVLLTALSGMLLTYLVLRTRSIYTSMFAHFVNNAAAVLLVTGNVPASIQTLFEEESLEANGLPAWLFVGSLVVFALGIFLLERSAKSNTRGVAA